MTIGFPCNQVGQPFRGLSRSRCNLLTEQFKAQEPGTDDEVLQFCQMNYGVTFPIAKKGDVNGPDTQPIWKYLKENAEEPVDQIDWVGLRP